MEISQKYLDKLKGWEYEEYKDLSKIDFRGRKYKEILPFIFQCILCLLFAIIYILIRQQDSSNWLRTFGFTFLIGLLCPLSWIPTILLSEYLYEKIYTHFSYKTRDYLRFKELEVKFVDIEKQIEQEAIKILTAVEDEVRERLFDNKKLNQFLYRKRNRQLYLYEIDKITKNYELNQKVLLIFDKNLVYIKNDSATHKHFGKLQLDLRFECLHFAGIVTQSSNTFSKSFSPKSPNNANVSNIKSTDSEYKKTQSQTNINNSNESNKEANKYLKPITNNKNPVSNNSEASQSKERTKDNKISDQNNKITQNEENTTLEPSKSSIFMSSEELNQLELDFESSKVALKNSSDIPKKRNTPKYEPIIKASPTFYLNLANKKIEIGMKGELLVMEHERLRLIEEGENPVKRLRHKSVLDGDGFGYDILSFENKANKYIEVKTTTGSFWSNLFFTQNEFNKMKELGEQYYLYRICNLSLETNQADLFIFNGEKMIISYFDFNSKLYVLTEKQDKV